MALIFGLLPVSVFAEEDGEELTETIPGSTLLTLDGTNPEGNDPNDTSNPYGVAYDPDGTGQGEIQVPWNELSVLVEDYDRNTHKINWYGKDKGSGKKKALGEFKNYSSSSVAYKNYIEVQSVAFDKTVNGSGRQAIVAYAGYNNSDNEYHLWTINTANGNKTADVVLDYWVNEGTSSKPNWKEFKPIFNDPDEKFDDYLDHYMANGFISITAGDFGRGCETVVVLAEFCARDGSNGTVTIAFEYDHWTNSEGNDSLARIGDPKIIDTAPSKKYVTTVSSATGDLNGDDVDELVVVLGRSDGPSKGSGETKLLVYPGIAHNSSSILSRSRSSTSVYEDYMDDGDSMRRTFTAPGVACGDVDGDGKEEVVIGGYQFISEDGGAYEDHKAQFIAIYRQNSDASMKKVIFTVPFMEDNETGMNAMIMGGFYENDDAHPRAAVATVAFNGQNGKDLIFFNGQIMTYNSDAGVTTTYTPDYFNEADHGASQGGVNRTISVGWVSDVAVGNFDHNSVGREQVYFVVALKQDSVEGYTYRIGMIGATYDDEQDMLGTLTGGGFYSSDIDADDYTLFDCDGYVSGDWVACHVVITACDMNNDGVRLRYRGKNYVYTDPKVEAVLQAAPYFESVQSPGSTAYSITTSYGESDNTTTSLDWGVGFSGEAKVSALAAAKMAIEAGAAFNYTWEWEDSWTTSYTSTFEATDQNTVLLQRTPILFYNYDMFDATTGKWAENAVQVPMPLGPVWSQLSVADYNTFVDEYDRMVEEIKASIDESQYTYEPPVLKKIEDTDKSSTESGEHLVGNEGNPEAYLHDWNDGDLTDAEKLSKDADMQLGYSGSSKTLEWAFDESHSEGEGFSGGFSINFTSQWGVSVILAETMAGFYVSADFMKGTCHYETTARSKAVSGTVVDLNERELRAQGITDEIIRAYQFFWSFGRWYIDMGTGSSDPELAKDLKEHVWDNSHVPVYGFKVANLSMPPLPPELSISYADGMFTLTWVDEHASAVDGYYVYQVAGGEYLPLNATRVDANTFTYSVPVDGLDDSSGNLFTFVVTSAVDLPSGSELQSVWSNEVTYVIAGQGEKGDDGVGIASIEKTGSEGNVDIYTVTLTDGTTYEYRVTNGETGD